MPGSSRRARRTLALPWRTALLAAAFGALVLRSAPMPTEPVEDAGRYGPGELRAALSGAVPAPVSATGPAALARDLPEVEDVLPLSTEGPSLAPTVIDVAPASFTGTGR